MNKKEVFDFEGKHYVPEFHKLAEPFYLVLLNDIIVTDEFGRMLVFNTVENAVDFIRGNKASLLKFMREDSICVNIQQYSYFEKNGVEHFVLKASP